MVRKLRGASSSPSDVSIANKVRENYKLLNLWIGRLRFGGDIGALVRSVEEYGEIFERNTGRPLAEASILEIGFGARPLRMMTFHSLGLDAIGVDLETPVLKREVRTLLRIRESHGTERALKSAVRMLVFDRQEERALADCLGIRNVGLKLDHGRLFVADAADLELEDESLDLVVSEDVFEHIQKESLEKIVDCMARWLKPGGLALIRPMVFTGISGNHLIDWYPHRVLSGTLPSSTEPWEHLRKRRAVPNNYLNELSRAEYRTLFGKNFTIEEERVKFPNLGRDLFTPEIAEELSGWPDEELFSNSIQFVLRPKKTRNGRTNQRSEIDNH